MLALRHGELILGIFVTSCTCWSGPASRKHFIGVQALNVGWDTEWS